MITSGAPFSVLNRPSIEANADGCMCATLCAARSPVGKICSTQKISAATTPTRSEILANSWCRSISRKKAPIAANTNAPVIAAPLMLCAYCQPTQGLVSRPQNESSCADLPLPEYATGCCIQALVAMMKKPDSHEPTNTNSAEIQCTRGLTRLRPARKIPRNTDSAKNANTPSIASVWPITPPA